jgi:hypothetical protein
LLPQPWLVKLLIFPSYRDGENVKSRNTN